MTRETARVLVVRDEKFAVVDGRLLLLESEVEDAVFLGEHRDTALYVTSGRDVDGELLDFRAAAAILDAADIALMSWAKGMLNWQARARFCGACGGPLEPRGKARVCTACGAEWFPRIDPAVMMLATHDDRILLAQHHGRASAFWSTLAGFVEPGETLEQAVARELHEETGLAAKDIRYFGSQPWPLPASLMIGFTMEVESPELTIDESELADARWFAREELDSITLSGKISLSRWMIEAWRATGS